MTKRRHRRYNKRRNKHSDDLFEPIIGAIGLSVAALYLNNAGLPTTKEAIYTFLAMIFGVVVTTLLFILLLGAYLKKRRRARLYRQQQFLFELQDLHPKDFEEYLAALYEQQGYTTATTRYQADHGIDVVLKKDGKKYAVQAKRYSDKNYVGEPAVRDFFGSYADSDYAGGFFVTTSFFSKAAQEWAKGRNIELIDGKRLEQMIHR